MAFSRSFSGSSISALMAPISPEASRMTSVFAESAWLMMTRCGVGPSPRLAQNCITLPPIVWSKPWIMVCSLHRYTTPNTGNSSETARANEARRHHPVSSANGPASSQTTQSAARRTRAVDADAARARHAKQQETAGNADVLPEVNEHVMLDGRIGDVPEIVTQHGGCDRVHGHDEPERPDLEAEYEEHPPERFDSDGNGRRDLHEWHALRVQISDEAGVAKQLHHATPQKQHREGNTCDEDYAGIDGTRHERAPVKNMQKTGLISDSSRTLSSEYVHYPGFPSEKTRRPARVRRRSGSQNVVRRSGSGLLRGRQLVIFLSSHRGRSHGGRGASSRNSLPRGVRCEQ